MGAIFILFARLLADYASFNLSSTDCRQFFIRSGSTSSFSCETYFETASSIYSNLAF